MTSSMPKVHAKCFPRRHQGRSIANWPRGQAFAIHWILLLSYPRTIEIIDPKNNFTFVNQIVSSRIQIAGISMIRLARLKGILILTEVASYEWQDIIGSQVWEWDGLRRTTSLCPQREDVRYPETLLYQPRWCLSLRRLRVNEIQCRSRTILQLYRSRIPWCFHWVVDLDNSRQISKSI